MIKKETKEVPAYTREYVTEYECDGCGVKTDASGNWKKDFYHYSETTIELDEGSRWPEGGDSTKTSYDLCPKCMKKVFEFIEAMRGIPPHEETTDW